MLGSGRGLLTYLQDSDDRHDTPQKPQRPRPPPPTKSTPSPAHPATLAPHQIPTHSLTRARLEAIHRLLQEVWSSVIRYPGAIKNRRRSSCSCEKVHPDAFAEWEGQCDSGSRNSCK